MALLMLSGRKWWQSCAVRAKATCAELASQPPPFFWREGPFGPRVSVRAALPLRRSLMINSDYDYLTIWLSDFLIFWLSDYLIIWLSDYLSIWVSEYLSIWLSDYLIIWSSDYLIIWLSDCLIIWLSIDMDNVSSKYNVKWYNMIDDNNRKNERSHGPWHHGNWGMTILNRDNDRQWHDRQNYQFYYEKHFLHSL